MGHTADRFYIFDLQISENFVDFHEKWFRPDFYDSTDHYNYDQLYMGNGAIKDTPGIIIVFKLSTLQKLQIQCICMFNYMPLFTKRMDVSPQDLMKTRSHDIQV